MSIDDANRLEYDDAILLWELYQRGLAGPTMHYTTSYHTMNYLHGLQQTLVAVNSKKKRKPDEMAPFKKLFPNANAAVHLLTPEDVMERDKQQKMKGLATSLGMPKHIMERLGL